MANYPFVSSGSTYAGSTTYPLSGDTTGTTDSTIINALLSRGGSVQLGTGTYYLKTTLALAVAGNRLLGNSWGSSILQPVAAFAADSSGAIISVTTPHCEVGTHQILGGPSVTYTSNPAVSAGIEVGPLAQYVNVHDISSYYINGWEIEGQASTAGFPLGGFIRAIQGFQHNKGIHLKGNGSAAAGVFAMQWQITDVQHGQIAGDSLFIEDSQDVSVKGHNDSVTGASGGSALHIKGACAGINVVNCDLGVFPTPGTATVVLIEDATRTTGATVTVNGTTTMTDSAASFTNNDIGRTVGTANVTVGTTIASVTNASTAVLSAAATGSSGPQVATFSSSPGQNIEIGPGIVQQGLVGAQINGGANLVTFRGVTFSRQQTHGAVVNGTGIFQAGGTIFGGVGGDCIHFTDCVFNNNGLQGSGTNYDVNWTGAVTGSVRLSRFSTTIVGSGAGVAHSANFTGGSVAFDDNSMQALNLTVANAFGTVPALTRRNKLYNPVGVVVVAVPGTGVAVAAASYDRDFYVTAGASTCTCVVAGGASVVIPSGGFGTVFVPAAQTMTPTYASAPTWVVNGY